MKERLRDDLQELEETIYPKYQETAYNVSVEKAALGENIQKLTSEISRRGEEWHRELEKIIMKLKSLFIFIQLASRQTARVESSQ